MRLGCTSSLYLWNNSKNQTDEKVKSVKIPLSSSDGGEAKMQRSGTHVFQVLSAYQVHFLISITILTLFTGFLIFITHLSKSVHETSKPNQKS